MSILGAGHGRSGQKAEETQEDVLPLGRITVILFVIGAALLGLGLRDTTVLFELAFVFLAGSFVGLGIFLFEDWLSGSDADLLDAFTSRDRRGRVIPGLRLLSLLADKKTNRKGLLKNQPGASLLALAAGKNDAGLHQEIASALGAKSAAGEDLPARLAQHAESSMTTRIAFATRFGSRAATEAAGGLPARLWPRALATLLASKEGPARLAALHCGGIPRRRLLALAVGDPEFPVREAAAEWLRDGLSRREVLALLGSEHADARLLAAASSVLPRRRRLRLCVRDPDAGVRSTAWQTLRPDLEASEALALSRSRFPDAVRWAISSGELQHRHLLRLVSAENLPAELRRLAYEQVRKLRGPKEW